MAKLPLDIALMGGQFARLKDTQGKQFDQPEDQWSIINGYVQQQYGTPWRYGVYNSLKMPSAQDAQNAYNRYQYENIFPQDINRSIDHGQF